MSIIRNLVCALALGAAALVQAGEPVDINTAGAEALARAISGVGLKKARAIVAYREQHGPFTSVEELAKVRGIGARTVERSRANLTVRQAR